MLPPTIARYPRPVSRWPRIEEVVDLPLVPVTQTTRSRSASCSQSPEAAGQHHTRLPQPVGLPAVAADPWGLHHDLAAQQRAKAAVGGGQDVLVSTFSHCGIVVHKHGLDAERAQLAEVRLALAAETPDADASPRRSPSPASVVPGS